MALVLNGSTDTITGLQINSANIVNGSITAADLATGVGGKILQIKSFTKNDTTSFELSSGYYSNSTQTGMQVSITPSNASNKILLLGMINIDIAGQQYNIGVALDKDGSILSGSIGDTAGSRKRVTALGSGEVHDDYAPTIPVIYEDTAGGTSAITYGLVANNPSSISRYVYINRSVGDPNATYGRRAVSTLTAIEVGQ